MLCKFGEFCPFFNESFSFSNLTAEQLFAGTGTAGFVGSILGTLLVFGIMIVMLAFIAIYVYWAFAWMTLARRLGYDKAWLAWIPIANLFLIPILAKKHWTWGFILLVPVANLVFIILWLWKIYELRGYPGLLITSNIFHLHIIE